MYMRKPLCGVWSVRKMCKDETAFGLVEKGKGRLAVRFNNLRAASVFARVNTLNEKLFTAFVSAVEQRLK